ncbi:MAG: YraN family protein [Planctomycetes bacterium]|nr:YraN family protein [Planctomycetota bacterium]
MLEESKRYGRRSESLAVALVEQGGLTVLARNVRAGNDEIDILASDGPVLVLVEVKARSRGFETADLAFTHGKRQRLMRAWRRLVAERRVRWTPAVRCDLVLIDGNGQATHIRDV